MDRFTVFGAVALAVVGGGLGGCGGSDTSGSGASASTTTQGVGGQGGGGGVGTGMGGESSSTEATGTSVGGSGGATTTSSSTTGTGGSGGSVPPTPGDTCAMATVTDIAIGQTIMVDGTTAGFKHDYQSFCGDQNSPMEPDVVYAFKVPGKSVLRVTAASSPGSALLPVLDIRTDCTMTGACNDFYQLPSQTSILDADAGTYYVIVNGQSQTSGAFTLTVELTDRKCGDGFVSDGETCDPGTAVVNDGCGDPGGADACKVQAATKGDACANAESISVPKGVTTLSSSQGYSTYGFKDDYIGSCMDPTSVGGPDRVFQITPTVSGTMTVSVGYKVDGTTAVCKKDINDPGCWGYALYARSTCGDDNTEIDCSDDVDDFFAPETIMFSVTANQPVFVFVDGYDAHPYSYGPFNLNINLQ